MTSRQEIGQKGAQARNQKLSSKKPSDASKEAVTRKQNEPQVLSKMDQKGGSQPQKRRSK
ncbi:MAG: hypothetical protein A3E87_00660 [Gammaproteobacteria bacterium RIFCSPHIGHO2_12_FULL_35_23]|nr:MAG: hypothetical protein A3E87_00660 [Gammaproteobacteria bacterium RIFCSPHIGHO2_12_FULL_35_23]